MNTPRLLSSPVLLRPRSVPPGCSALIATHGRLIDQAQDLAAHFLGWPGAEYAQRVGPHLRHVIEHLQALCLRTDPDTVDYDQRVRDLAMEQRPERAIAALHRLRQALQAMGDDELARAVEVRGQTGLCGEACFTVLSSVARELAYLASHTVHHFALLHEHATRLGWMPPPHFGQAPATVAHALKTRN